MTNKKQPCNRRTCPIYKTAHESNETQTSWHTCLSSSETYNETENADGFPAAVEEPSSQMTLLQKIRDPQQFMLGLQNIVDLAENLLAAITDAVEGGANKLRRSISSIISPESWVENTPENIRNIYCDDEMHITVTIPLTLHIRPKIAGDWVLSEPMDEEMGEPIEPIRTASISMSPGPRMMHFVEEDQMGEKDSLPEPASVAPQDLPLPQQKDLNLCTPCNCKNCPLYDDNRVVVCPQNCGCCSCPWGGNMDATTFCHREVKICGCTHDSMNTPSTVKRCECLPNFDICACRDIAESRHIELYGTEMYADGPKKDRDGVTQNDRYRDHSNLSNQPNIEASAGLRQQPAGPIEIQQAKDDEKNERSSTDQYYTPRGSYLSSSEQTGECCNESSSPTLMSAGGSNKPPTRNGSALICFSTNFNDSLEEQVSDPPKYVFSEQYWAPNDSFQQQQADGNILQRSEQQKREELDNCIQNLYGLHFKRKSSSFTCIARNNSSSLGSGEKRETNHQEAIQSYSSEETIFYTPRDSSANALSAQQPITSSDINTPDNVIEKDITAWDSKEKRLLQLLENIYELLQCMREDHRQTIDRPSKFEADESSNDLPPPPPSSPSLGQQIQISCTPPFNIFISPMAMQQAEDLERPAWLDTSQYIVENQGVDLLEPPERDVDIEDHHPIAGTQRLVPLDMDLLETDYNFELEAGNESRECQVNESSLEDMMGSGIFKEIQVKSEDLALVKDDPSSDKVRQPTAQFLQLTLDPSESQELETGAVTCCQRQDNTSNSTQLKDLSDMVSDESVKKFSQRFARKMEDDLCECVCENPKESAETCCTFLNSYHSISIENPSDHLNPSHVSCSGQISHVKPEPGMTQEVQVNTNSKQSVVPQLAQLPMEKVPASAPATTKVNIGTNRPQFDKEYPRSDTPVCHCPQATAKPQKPEARDFIDSILCDLKTMKEIRENACRRPIETGIQMHPTDISYPVTIVTVQELGPNSLFIKWKVHNCANIAGYEIFLDDRLTYRYFNGLHRAAVICNVNLQYPHQIILRAQPKLHTKPSPLACNSELFTSATTASRINAAACYPQPDGSIWYPSVFHFEPNFYSAPANTSFDD